MGRQQTRFPLLFPDWLWKHQMYVLVLSPAGKLFNINENLQFFMFLFILALSCFNSQCRLIIEENLIFAPALLLPFSAWGTFA